MKVKLLVLSFLAGAIILFVGHKNGGAKSSKEEKAVRRIGVVSMRTIFQNCKRNEKYRKQAELEQEQILQELQQLSAEIKAAEAGLETRKRGTEDFLELAKELAQKRAELPLKQDYYQQKLEAQDQQWTEQIYKDILLQTAEVAKQMELDIVFEKDEPTFPAESANELMLAIRTNKLLYSEGCIDITNEVMARVDAMGSN